MSANVLVMVVAACSCRVGAALAFGRAGMGRRRLPLVTVLMVALVATGFLLQQMHPAVLPMFERNQARLAEGELWRLGTALFFQDGGTAGAAFNLVLLAAVGAIAEQLWSKGQWLLLYLGGGVVSQILALYWQPIGAGNSMACLVLAGGCLSFGLARDTPRLLKGVSVAGLLTGAVLISLRNIHGAPVFLGALSGWLLRSHVGQSRAEG